MCIFGGPNHKHDLSCKLYTTQMTRQELVDLIAKQGFKAEVTEEEGSHYVRITTEQNLPQKVKDVIEASLPAGVKASYVTRLNEVFYSDSLKDWMEKIRKYLK